MAERHILCAADAIEPGEAKRFKIDKEQIAVVRIEDSFYAIGDICSHADYSLADGEVWPEECMIECWKHGSRFSLETGEPDTLPATQPVPVYAVAVEDDQIVVDK